MRTKRGEILAERRKKIVASGIKLESLDEINDEPKKEKPMAKFIKVNTKTGAPVYIAVKSIMAIGTRGNSQGSWIQYGSGEEDTAIVRESPEDVLTLIDSTAEKLGGGE